MAKKASRMGDNPLDAYSSAPADEAPSKAPATRAKRNPEAPERGGSSKKHATFHMDAGLVEEMRGAVVALAAQRLTLADIAENGIRGELEKLRAKFNKGKPFPAPDMTLKGGRRVGY